MTAADKARELARKWEAEAGDIKIKWRHTSDKDLHNAYMDSVLAIESCLTDLRAVFNLEDGE